MAVHNGGRRRVGTGRARLSEERNVTNGISDVAGLCQSPGSQQAIEAVTAALKVNDIDKAIELARTALNEGVVHPLLLNLRAYWL